MESTDGYTGTLPATIAELLELPSVTFARALDVADGAIRAERQTATGYDVVTCPLPAVVTLTAGATEPRYPSLKGVMAAKQKPFDRLTVADLGLDADALTPSQRVVDRGGRAHQGGRRDDRRGRRRRRAHRRPAGRSEGDLTMTTVWVAAEHDGTGRSAPPPVNSSRRRARSVTPWT